MGGVRNGNMTERALREGELGDLALRNVEILAFPPTDWEATALAEVLTLPRVAVTRPPTAELLAAGMVPYDCHHNCAAQVANDPDRASRQISGWLQAAHGRWYHRGQHRSYCARVGSGEDDDLPALAFACRSLAGSLPQDWRDTGNPR